MSLFIETIRIDNGDLKNLQFHQARFEQTRREIFGFKIHPALEEKINLPVHAKKGLFKCRVLYDQGEIQVEIQKYDRPEINSLKLIRCDDINYSYKSADRSKLTKLYQQREDNDDILIVKNERITDSYFANVALWDGNQWLTPENPLLEGCMRASLLKNDRIKKADILVKDLSNFQSLRLINALNDLDDSPYLPINALSW